MLGSYVGLMQLASTLRRMIAVEEGEKGTVSGRMPRVLSRVYNSHCPKKNNVHRHSARKWPLKSHSTPYAHLEYLFRPSNVVPFSDNRVPRRRGLI